MSGPLTFSVIRKFVTLVNARLILTHLRTAILGFSPIWLERPKITDGMAFYMELHNRPRRDADLNHCYCSRQLRLKRKACGWPNGDSATAPLLTTVVSGSGTMRKCQRVQGLPVTGGTADEICSL